MKFRLSSTLAAAALGMALSTPAMAQDRPTIAIMPAQYFSADAESAERLTESLAQQFEQQGYTVVSLENSRSKFSGMGLSPSQHYSDQTALRFGRELNADLVAYPRLLALGLPVASTAEREGLLEPAAVVHLRVLNVHSRQPIYFRQVAHEYRTDIAAAPEEFTLPEPVAVAAAQDVTNIYFQRVAGSRQEYRGMR